MRTKSVGGGTARISKLRPHPSAVAFSYLGQPTDSKAHPNCSHNGNKVNEDNNDDGQCSIAPEPSRDSDHNRGCREFAPNTTGETVDLAENSGGLGPQEACGPEDSSLMDWTENNVCIKCDKGGKLLVCSDISCPLAVHEECMRGSARFDSMGNFYCPYCSYKRAMLETRKARKKAMLAKKALSVFLDKGMMDGAAQKLKAEKIRRKELNSSIVVGDMRHDDIRNRLDGEADSHIGQMEEDRREERFDICEGAAASAVNEQNVVLSRGGDNARPDDGGQHKIVIEQHMHPGQIVAGGGGGACCGEEVTGNRFEIGVVDNSIQPEYQTLVDNHQNELQDEQRAGPLHVTHVAKETELDGALHMSTDGESDYGDRVNEHEGNRAEEEVMQDQEQGTTASSTGGDSMQQEHVKANDLSNGYQGDVSPHWRRVKKKNQNGVQPPSADGPRRSARKLSKQNTSVVHKQKKNATKNQNAVQPPSADSPRRSARKLSKKNATNKSRPQITSPTYPHRRRKKVSWTIEEVDMLKEGVQKFSTMVNKNLPWRKILEFGRHVFDAARTPRDLKDKWWHGLVKEC